MFGYILRRVLQIIPVMILISLVSFSLMYVLPGDPALAIIPVVVLTTSRAEADVLRSYRLHANCYITKPVDLDQFVRVVHSIEEFWFTIVRLAPNGEAAT